MYKIMIVDDNRMNLAVAKKTLEEDYIILPFLSSLDALNDLKQQKELPDLILSDIEMPIMTGLEFVGIIKNDKRLCNIPVIFLTSHNNPEIEITGLALGAVDYIKKPFIPELTKQRISLHLKMEQQQEQLKKYNLNLEKMVARKTKSISDLQQVVLSVITDLIDQRDGYTGGHVRRVQMYMLLLMRHMLNNGMVDEGITERDITVIVASSRLHDVGKISVPDNILLKNDRLTESEIERIKLHTINGANSISKAMEQMPDNEFMRFAYQMAKSHHERWDGKGYPEGLNGANIPFIARVMAVTDVYDALTSDRVYRKPIPHSEAVVYITEGSGTQFDPHIVDAFLQVESKFESTLKYVSRQDKK